MSSYVVMTAEGAEELLVAECSEKSIAAEKMGRMLVRVDTSSLEMIKDLQLAIWVLDAERCIKIESLEDILSGDFSGVFREVKCIREGDHAFTSQQVRDGLRKQVTIQKEAAGILGVFVVDETCVFGMLVSEKKLTTRRYRVRIHRLGVPPLVAAAAIRFSDIPQDILVCDPFCLDGGILLEAARMNYRTEGFGSENDVRNAEINAKVGGFAIVLRTDFYEKVPEGCFVVTRPFEFFSKMRSEKVSARLQKVLQVLKEKEVVGITFVMTNPGNVAEIVETAGYKVLKKAEIQTGGLSWTLLKIG